MNQIKSKNRNRMANKTLEDSLRLATTNIGVDVAMIVSEKTQPQAFTLRGFVINCCLLLCNYNNFNDAFNYYLPFCVLNLCNLLFYTSFCWKWPAKLSHL